MTLVWFFIFPPCTGFCHLELVGWLSFSSFSRGIYSAQDGANSYIHSRVVIPIPSVCLVFGDIASIQFCFSATVGCLQQFD